MACICIVRAGVAKCPFIVCLGVVMKYNIIKELVGMTLQDVELMLILETLKSVDGNRKKAAQILRIGERTLYRKITPNY